MLCCKEDDDVAQVGKRCYCTFAKDFSHKEWRQKKVGRNEKKEEDPTILIGYNKEGWLSQYSKGRIKRFKLQTWLYITDQILFGQRK